MLFNDHCELLPTFWYAYHIILHNNNKQANKNTFHGVGMENTAVYRCKDG